MDFSISVSGLKCSIGNFSAVTFRPKDATAYELLTESASRAHDLDLVLALDVSGSMGPNMKTLIDSALGTVDIMADGATLRVLTFDSEVKEVLKKTRIFGNRADIKDIIRRGINNVGGLTNIENILTEVLMGLNQNIIFLSDGTANRGILQTSSELLDLAHNMPNFLKNTIHCLGLQLSCCDLNGLLLKNLAQETSGIYILAHDLETVSTFLGDVMANHLMSRFRDSLLKLTYAGAVAKMISSVPSHGFLLRADRPTTLVFESSEISEMAHVYFSGTSGTVEPDRLLYETDIAVGLADAATEALILKALSGHCFETDRARIPDLVALLKSSVAAGSVHLAPLLVKCEAVLASNNESVASANIYEMQTIGPQESDTVHYMRHTSLQASQSQDPM